MTSMMEDVDASLEEFFQGCHGAGPEICPFYEPTVSAISAKLDALTESVKQQPIAVVTPGSYGLVDVGFLRNTVLEALFDPYDNVSGFVPLGKSLAALAKRDATLIYNQSAVPTFECSASNSTTLHENNLEAYMTIGCGDAILINDTLAELQDYWVGGLKVSSYSDLLSSTRVFCARVFPYYLSSCLLMPLYRGYKTHRPGRFQGECKLIWSPMYLISIPQDPSAPKTLASRCCSWATGWMREPLMLGELIWGHCEADEWLTNIRLPSAVQTAEAFPGSVVLTQDSLGVRMNLSTLNTRTELHLDSTPPLSPRPNASGDISANIL